MLLKLHILNMYILCLNWGIVVGLFDLFYISLTIKMQIIIKPFRSILERQSNGDNKSISRVQW